LFIQSSAEDDILLQIERYAEHQVLDIARQFSVAVKAGVEASLKAPLAGALRETSNPKLSDLRTWPVKGFDEHRIYYLIRDDVLQIIRVLHGKRDIARIMEGQDADDPFVPSCERFESVAF
jgi:toxin ParE1/3/4